MLSRVADSLYWVGRYLERAEHTARLLDVNLSLMLDQSPEAAEHRWERLQRSLEWRYHGDLNAYSIAEALILDPANPSSIQASIASARENARQVREQISSEMWEHLNRLSLQVKQASMSVMWANQSHDFLHGVIKEGVQLFQGITNATLSRNESWYWLRLGQFMERASATISVLDSYFMHGTIPRDLTQVAYLEWVALLKSCTSFEAYCNVYTADIRPERIAEFLLLNEESPRSVRFCADRISESIQAIAKQTTTRRADRPKRLAGRLQALLDYGQVDEIIAEGLHQYLASILQQCNQIDQAIYQSFISYPIETALAS